MDLPMVGEVVTRVAFDAAVSLLAGAGELRIECPFDLVVAGATTRGVKPSDAASHAGILVRQHGRRVTAARVERAVLELRIGDDFAIHVGPNDAYEAWTYAGEDGTVVVSMPGGELATWGPRESRTE